MKACISCKETKPLDEFYLHSRMADGHLGKCRQCYRRDISANIARRSKDPAWMAKERERSRIKSAKYRTSGKKFKQSKNSQSEWLKRNRHKSRAHSRARRAFPRTVATICERCGKVPKILHRHHPDYSKPIQIMWLCPPCHGIVHRK